MSRILASILLLSAAPLLRCASAAESLQLQAPGATEPAYVQRARKLTAQASAAAAHGAQIQAHDLWKQAWITLKPYMGAHGGSARILHLAGQLLARMRHYSEAFGYLQQAHQVDPADAGILYDMGSCTFNQGLWQASRGYWSELETMEAPGLGLIQRATIAYNHGVSAAELDLIPEAIDALTRAVSMAPDKASLETFRYELAARLFSEGKYKPAAREFAALAIANPMRWEYSFHLGTCHLELGDLDAAERELLAARRLNEGSDRILQKLGNLWFRRGEFDQAEGYYMLAIEKNQYAEDALRKLIRINHSRGDPGTVAELTKKYKRASKLSYNVTEELRKLRRRILRNRNDIAAHKRRIEVYLQNQRQTRASKAISQLLAVKPRQTWALLNSSRLLLRQGRMYDALFELEKVLEVEPYNPFANRDLGQVLGSQRRFQDAVPYLLRALNGYSNGKNKDPRSLVQVHQMLASCFASLGDPKRAKVHTDAADRISAELKKNGGEGDKRP